MFKLRIVPRYEDYAPCPPAPHFATCEEVAAAGAGFYLAEDTGAADVAMFHTLDDADMAVHYLIYGDKPVDEYCYYLDLEAGEYAGPLYEIRDADDDTVVRVI